MVEENRKFLYKDSKTSVSDIRLKFRCASNYIRKDKREQIISTKRFRDEKYSVHANSQEHFDVEKVKNVAKEFQKKSNNLQDQLKYLRTAFSYTSDFVNAFLETDNALYTLVGYLTGNISTLQLEAAWCITNISANDHKHLLTVVKATAPYLITYLQGGSALLQDQSAWALGNMAADSQVVRELLKKQGVIQPLINIAKSDTDGVVQSSLFALCNMSRSFDLVLPEIQDSDLIDTLISKFSSSSTDLNVLSEVAWLLTYVITNEMCVQTLHQKNIVKHLSFWLCKVRPHQQEFYFAVTPILRCLGNLLGSTYVTDVHAILSSDDGLLLQTLDSFLSSNKRYLIKECLWVLSNLFTDKYVSETFCDQIRPLLTNITRHLDSAYEIKKEAVVCLCNLVFHKPEYADIVINKNVFEMIISIFKLPDIEIVSLALLFFELVLRQPCSCQLFDELDGPSYLEALEYNDSAEIRTKAIQMQRTYFETDDELAET